MSPYSPHKMMQKKRVPWLAVCAVMLLWLPVAEAETAATYVERIASLIEPAKLATLGKRAANPRVQKYVAQLAEAWREGIDTTSVVHKAVAEAGMKGEAAKLTGEAMVRNLTIANRLGCLDADGLKEMRQGKAATIKRGPYAGDQLSVDHIIPRAVVPELDNVIANLELMPMRMNAGKNDKVGARQLDLANKLKTAGLLSTKGMKRLRSAAK